MNAPSEIWLQWDPDGDAEMYDYPSEGVTWCSEQVHDTDVRYVRADVAEADAVRADTDSLRTEPPAAPERWEPVDERAIINGGSDMLDRTRYIEINGNRIGITMDGRELYALLPDGYALCERLELLEEVQP